MKNLKKLFAVILSLAMVLGMSITTFADTPGNDGVYGTADDEGTITVSGIEENATVTAYKVVEAKYENNGGSFSGYNSLYTSVILNDDLNGDLSLDRETLNALADAVNADTAKTAIPMAYANGKYTATVKPGTYLVLVTDAETNIYNPMVVSVYYTNEDGSTNDLVEGNLTIAEGDAEAKVSSQPSVDKVITNTKKADENDKGNSGNIGDTVGYEVSVNPVPNYNGSYPVFNVVDTLSKGLEYKDDLSVKVDGADVPEEYYTVVVNPTAKTDANRDSVTTITVNFVVDDEYMLNEYAGKKLVITYSATLKENADLNENANINDITLNYTRDSKTEGNDESDNDKTYTYTFDIDGEATGTKGIINKLGDKDEDKDGLNGASFALYKESQLKEDGTFDGNPFKTTESATEGTKKGQLHFTGLEAGTYYLQETSAPTGYSVNTTIFKVVISAKYNTDGTLKEWNVAVGEGVDSTPTVAATFTVDSEGAHPGTNPGHDIMNTTLSQLPSTGGIGTTIFTIAGCVIMIVAAGLFFASRKKRA